MKRLNNDNLENIIGGSTSVGVIGTIALVVTTISVLVSGIFEGYTHPRGCND